MKKLLTLLLVVLFSPACAQNPPTGLLDSLFNALAEKNLAMGSLTISKDGRVLYQRAIGSSHAGNETPAVANVHTKYKVGSVSKLFTAVLIFQLIEEGKIDLTHTLDQYFHQLPHANTITIDHLLSHRSGLSNYTEDPDFFESWMDKPQTHEQLLQRIVDKKPDFLPGTQSRYSNSNYLLLSYIIEQICQKPYEKILKERITDKIGLQNTYYGGLSEEKLNESLSYTYFNTVWKKEKETHPSIHSGAGSLVSTPTDLTRFMEALFGNKLVNRESVEKMKTLTDSIGRGLWPYVLDTSTGYGHGGKIEGFLAYAYYFPEEKLAVAYCTNGYVYPASDIVDGVFRICMNKPYTIPTFRPVRLPTIELDQYLGTYRSGGTMPMIVICTKNEGGLVLETKGQNIEISALGNGRFRHPAFGFFFEFNLEKETLVIKESDKAYYLTKD